MIKEILKRTGRRGATVAAVAAVVAAGVGMPSGVANADGVGWYWLYEHPTGHNVGIYSEPNSESAKVAADLSSTELSADQALLIGWSTGENINNLGDVWYQVSEVYYGNSGVHEVVSGFIYGAYTDDNWNYDYGGLRS